MSNPTSNFGWQMPTPVDLVTDLPADFEVFGQAVDTSLADLKGGTSGQILAKNSNTDMDFVWIANDQGDITEITASAPLTGGGTSGAITVGIQDGTTTQKGAVQLENSTSSTSTTTAAVPASVKSAFDLANAAIPKSIVDAAGDLIYATANDTPARLALGTAGQVLTVNAGATAPEWATPAAGGGGKVLQVVSSGHSTQVATSSSTYADTGLTATITPTSATSKILVLVNQVGCSRYSGSSNTSMNLQLLRGSTSITVFEKYFGFNGSDVEINGGASSTSYVDAPATTSATTYKTQLRRDPGGSTGTFAVQANGGQSTIVLLEIGA